MTSDQRIKAEMDKKKESFGSSPTFNGHEKRLMGLS